MSLEGWVNEHTPKAEPIKEPVAAGSSDLHEAAATLRQISVQEAVGAPPATPLSREGMLRERAAFDERQTADAEQVTDSVAPIDMTAERAAFDAREQQAAAAASEVPVDAAAVQADIDQIIATGEVQLETPRIFSADDITKLREKMDSAHGAEQTSQESAAGQAEYASLDELTAQVDAQMTEIQNIRTDLGYTYSEARKVAILDGFGAAEKALRDTQGHLRELQGQITGLDELSDFEFSELMNLRGRAAKHIARVGRAKQRIMEQQMYPALLQERSDDLRSQLPEQTDEAAQVMLEELGAGYEMAEPNEGPEVFYDQMEATETAGAIHGALASRAAKQAATAKELPASRKDVLGSLRNLVGAGGGGNGIEGGGSERGGRRRGWRRAAAVAVLLLGAFGASFDKKSEVAAGAEVEQQIEISHTVEDGDWVTSVMIDTFPQLFGDIPMSQQDDVTKRMMELAKAAHGDNFQNFLVGMGVESGDQDKIYPGQVLQLHQLQSFAEAAVAEWRAGQDVLPAPMEAPLAPERPGAEPETGGFSLFGSAQAAEVGESVEFNKGETRTYIVQPGDGGATYIFKDLNSKLLAGLDDNAQALVLNQGLQAFKAANPNWQQIVAENGFQGGDPGNVEPGDEVTVDFLTPYVKSALQQRLGIADSAVLTQDAPPAPRLEVGVAEPGDSESRVLVDEMEPPAPRPADLAARVEASTAADKTVEVGEAAPDSDPRMTITESLTADLWNKYSDEFVDELNPYKARILNRALQSWQTENATETLDGQTAAGENFAITNVDVLPAGISVDTTSLKKHLDAAAAFYAAQAGIYE